MKFRKNASQKTASFRVNMARAEARHRVWIRLRMIKISHRGRWKWSSIFWTSHPSKKNCFQKLWLKKKNLICHIFHQKYFQKVLMKINEIEDVFLNSVNFEQHTLLTLDQPSNFFWNLKVLIKVSKVSWKSQLSH